MKWRGAFALLPRTPLAVYLILLYNNRLLSGQLLSPYRYRAVCNKTIDLHLFYWWLLRVQQSLFYLLFRYKETCARRIYLPLTNYRIAKSYGRWLRLYAPAPTHDNCYY